MFIVCCLGVKDMAAWSHGRMLKSLNFTFQEKKRQLSDIGEGTYLSLCFSMSLKIRSVKVLLTLVVISSRIMYLTTIVVSKLTMVTNLSDVTMITML
jgi:hypothetical protein